MANDGSVKIGVDLDDAAFKSALSSLGGFASKGLKATVGAIGVASTALAGVGIAGVKVGMDFESSMSQVGATMGMTADEIRNGSEDFKLLEKAAMDAGKSTKFTAKESADALNYLALAGYDAEKSAAALPVVLNLAAAGGLDLAYASDLVTDSMSALGMQTSELQGFTDELAKTSQKSNTNVAQLGEAILTVGGTAKNLAGGTVELNTVLGILADNGIKGSEGGTALRNTILSLAAPMDQAAGKLKELNIKVFDASGNMRPLNETFKDLDASLSTLSEEDKINALSTIFNKRDLKAIEALLANCGGRFDELSGYIENSAGACSKTAETMNDNLAGAITILKSSLDGLGIEFYRNVDEPVKNVVKTLTGMIGQLTGILETDGVKGLVSGIGDMLANIVLSVSNFAPTMIEAGVSVIQAFLEGIDKNSTQIANGAVSIISSLTDGIFVLVPDMVSLGLDLIEAFLEGVTKNAEKIVTSGTEIVKNLINGIAKRLPEFINLAKTMVVTFAKEIGKAVPALQPFSNAVEFLMDRLNYLAVAVGTVVFSLKALTITQSITAMVTAFSAANAVLAGMMASNALQLIAVNGGLTVYQYAVGVLTGKLGLATAAQGLWSLALSANPIGVVVMLVAALTAGLVILTMTMNKTSEAEKARIAAIDEIKESTEELTEKVEENNKAYESSVESINSSRDASLAQMEYVKDLADELGTLADEEGNVDESNRARASFILGELNAALGTEYTLTGNQITNYKNMKTSIDELIMAEQSRIILKAYEEELTEAIKRETEAKKEAKVASEELSAIQEQQNGILQEFINKTNERTGLGLNEAKAIEEIQKGYKGCSSETKNLANSYLELSEKQKENMAVVENSGKTTKETAELKAQYSDLMRNKEEGNLAAITNAVVLTAEERKSIEENNGKEMLRLIEENKKEVIRLEEQKNQATTEAVRQGLQNLIDDAKEKGTLLVAEYEKTGKLAVDGLALGLADTQTAVNAAVNMANKVIAAAKATFDQHSPSKVFEEIGEYNMEGLKIGHDKGNKEVLQSINAITEKIVQSTIKNGEKIYDTQEELNKQKYNQAKEFIKLKAEQSELSVGEEVALWQYVGEQYKLTTAEQIEAEEAKNKALDDLRKEREKAEKDSFDNSKKWIDTQKQYNNLSLTEEYKAWERVQIRYAEGTELRADAELNLYKIKQQMINNINKEFLISINENNEKIIKSTKKNGKKIYETQEELNKKKYKQAKEFIKLKAEQSELSVEEEAALWQYVGEQYKLTTAEQIEVEKAKNKALDDLRKEREKAEKDSFDNSKKWIDTQKQYNNLSLAEEYKAWERVQGRYAEGTEMRADAELNLYKIKQQIVTDINKLEEDYAKEVDNRAKQIFNSYSLFQKIEPKEPVKGKELLDSLDSQVEAMKQWSRNIELLSERAIDKGLLEELTAMGPEANEQIKALLQMTEEDLTEYSNLYQEKSQIAREQAIAELEYLRIETEEKTAEIIKGIEDVFDQSPNIGFNLTLGLANGIRNGTPLVLRAGGELAKAFIGYVNKAFGINSPSKVFAQIGKYVDEGFAIGIEDNLNQIDTAMGHMEEAANLDSEFEIKFNTISDDFFQQGKTAGGDFYDGFTSILRKIDLGVLSTMAAMTPQSAYAGINSQSSNVTNTDNRKKIVQNFYSQTVSPYQAYKRMMQNEY